MTDRESLLDRFVRYARIDTQSAEGSTSYPSTAKQRDLLGSLVDDLRAAGLEDVAMDEWGYVMATVPSNIPAGHPAHGAVPTIGLLAHVDTYFDVPGANVAPIVHRDYDGGDLVRPGDQSVVIRAADEPALASCRGMTIITSDGTTLLGADDKAGVAEIVETVWRWKEDPLRLHGPVRVAFTPDEEVGRGTEHFDIGRFAADLAYTVDGSGVGEIEDETFSADSARVTVTGLDVHPGYAKDRMVNAVRVLSDMLMALPQHRTPEATDRREGYLHPVSITGNVSQAAAQLLVRAFTEDELRQLERLLTDAASWAERKYPGASVTVEVKPSYRNMRVAISRRPEVVEYAEEAVRRAGHVPRRGSVRGGTDGSRLSEKGLLTPNLSSGGMNFHSRKEWVPLEWMGAAVETILHLAEVWVEKSRDRGSGIRDQGSGIRDQGSGIRDQGSGISVVE